MFVKKNSWTKKSQDKKCFFFTKGNVCSYNSNEVKAMEKKYGTVDKIRTLQVSARPLIRFSLNEVNCLIASHSLNFLAEVDEGMKLVVTGYYNNRKQFVVRSYHVLGKPKIVVEYEKSLYPRKKVQ